MLGRGSGSYSGLQALKQQQRKDQLLVSTDRLLTDRSSYIAYLESQLERVSAACLTVTSFDERLEATAAATRAMEERLVSLARLVSVTQQFAEQQERVQREGLEEVRGVLRSVEAAVAELACPQRAAEWEERLQAVGKRVDAKLQELDASAEQRLADAATTLQRGLEARCHEAHVALQSQAGEAAARLDEVERKASALVRALDEFAHAQNSEQQVASLSARVAGMEDSLRVLATSDSSMRLSLGSLEAAVGKLRAAVLALEVRPAGAAAEAGPGGCSQPAHDLLARARAALQREVQTLEQQRQALAAGLGGVAAAAAAPPPSPAKAAVAQLAASMQTAVQDGTCQELQLLRQADRWMEGVQQLSTDGCQQQQQQQQQQQAGSKQQPEASEAAGWSIAAVPAPAAAASLAPQQQQGPGGSSAMEDALQLLRPLLLGQPGGQAPAGSSGAGNPAGAGLQASFVQMHRALEAVQRLLQEEARPSSAPALPPVAARYLARAKTGKQLSFREGDEAARPAWGAGGVNRSSSMRPGSSRAAAAEAARDSVLSQGAVEQRKQRLAQLYRELGQ